MRLLLLGICGLLAACAGQETRGHNVAVTSDPPGARCTVTDSNREPITELLATPTTIQLPISPRDMRFFCTRVGFAPSSVILRAEADASRMGVSALAGGMGGLAGAAISGQGYRYAPALNVVLQPANASSASDREQMLAARSAETRTLFDERIRLHRSMCRADEFGCQQMIAGIVRARDTELAQIEALR